MGWAYINRVIQAVAVGWGVVGDGQSLRYCWLYPIRDLMGFCVWCASFVGNEIVWRNERYRLIEGGKMLIQRARERS
jgi:ceramide glucosyltransferase